MYAIDRGSLGVGTGLRAFISDGPVLQRQKDWGSGESPSEASLLLDAYSAAPLQLKVEVANGTATRMGVFRGAKDAVHLGFDLDGVETTAELIWCGRSSIWGEPRLRLAGGAEIPLVPVPGSPGAFECPDIDPLADAGLDGGDAGAPARPAEASALVAGLQF